MTNERPEDVRDEMLDLIETDGIRAAVRAVIDVCESKTAPAAAKATAAGHIFRLSGLGGFGKSDEGAREKEPHEMTPVEFDAAVRRALHQAKGAAALTGSVDKESDLFD